jgi:hypothetical protein
MLRLILGWSASALFAPTAKRAPYRVRGEIIPWNVPGIMAADNHVGVGLSALHRGHAAI